ncbi:MAG: hypothetical protein E7603_10465 [Ruminococcaceae bacterium]|nr:hypothetical protein [Oscillospiraceae bacterium]
MNKYENLKQKLQNCDQILGTHIMLIASGPMMEVVNEDYLDYVIFDMEHGMFNNENLIPLLQACRLCGLPAFVRVPDHTNFHIARCLDLGADGIMIPRTETVAQVKAAVESMRFPPVGHKGKGGYCQVRQGETLEDFNKNRHLLVQIESPVGISALPDMLDAYGDEIAAIVIGPYDLSFTMNMPAQFNHPQFQAAVQKVFDICLARGKSVGIFCDSMEQARKYRQMGANFMWICTDDQILKAGLRAVIAPLTKQDI